MSTERVKLLLAEFAATVDQEGWFAPFEMALAGVTAADAAWTPGGGANSIWQTVNHVAFWKRLVAARMGGAPLTAEQINNNDTFGPPGDPSDAAGWKTAVGRLFEASAAIQEALGRLTDADLDRPLPGESRSLQDLLSGVVLHDGYHAGQIVLIRKLRGSWPSSRT